MAPAKKPAWAKNINSKRRVVEDYITGSAGPLSYYRDGAGNSTKIQVPGGSNIGHINENRDAVGVYYTITD